MQKFIENCKKLCSFSHFLSYISRGYAVGKPALFATTDEFLKRFGISSTKELPDYNKLMEDIEKIRENYSDSLFNRFEPVIQNQEDLDKKLNEISKQETEEDEEL